MKTAKNDVYKMITERFLKALNEGVIPWQIPWDQISKPHQNYKTKSKYSGVNVLLLMLSSRKMRFSSPYWLTFKQAKELGGNVKKGSRGTQVIFYKLWERETGKVNAKGEKVKDEIPVIRYYTVFNSEQIEGIAFKGMERPQRHHNPIEEAEKIADAYFKRDGAPALQYTDETRAYYSPLADYVNMPKREYFHTSEEIYSTLFHEMTHSTGHKSRLKRFEETAKIHGNSGSYSKEELVAEIGSAFLLSEAGIDSQKVTQNQKAYIQSWAKALENDPKMIVQASGKAQKAVNHILGLTE